MPQIYQLPLVSQASLGDQLAVYTPNNGDARRMSLNTLLAFFQQQFAAPTLATGTVTLPLNTITPDGTEVLITSTQIITTLTVALNGASNAFGAPTTLAANGFARLRFVQSQNSWYRIS